MLSTISFDISFIVFIFKLFDIFYIALGGALGSNREFLYGWREKGEIIASENMRTDLPHKKNKLLKFQTL